MTWTQIIDPLHNLPLSGLVAAVPIFLIFWSLIKKMKGYQTSLLALGSALLIAILVYGMPFKLAALSTLHGSLYGLFPICWIIISAVFLFNVTVKSGQFEVIKNFMASITPDRRLQALLIAFSFGAFLEGAAGFGAPVAISGAMLVGLGFNPLYAAGICLIANTAPVAFGSVGTPIFMASRMSDIPELAISQMVGRTLPILSLMLPLYLVVLMSGFKKSLEVLPAIIVSGASFAIVQWFTANYMGPMLPDVLAGITSIICLLVLLKYWKPEAIWRFSEESAATVDTELKYSNAQILRAWSPLAAVVGYAFVANYSGMSITMAFVLASTGALFPFFSPILGWLGVFLTGSDTSANALFSKLQANTADTLGFDPVVTVSANASGGVTGKMISPQSIAVGAAAVGLIGKESDLFRFTVKHSFIMLFVICILTCLQVYVMKWIVPAYQKIDTASASAGAAVNNAAAGQGFWYLLILALAVGLIVLTISMNKKKN
ncbi:MAG: L-lactate permease [Saprospiraceae bacterium]|nr:L-lactate permease [Saprospiraceae bacterium]